MAIIDNFINNMGQPGGLFAHFAAVEEHHKESKLWQGKASRGCANELVSCHLCIPFTYGDLCLRQWELGKHPYTLLIHCFPSTIIFHLQRPQKILMGENRRTSMKINCSLPLYFISNMEKS